MRIIAGTLKGRRLLSPSWEGLRPTSDRLRETLFNVLGPRIVGASVLDAYAGTGAIGLEAISRGARAVTFVEADRRAQALIAENLSKCGVERGYAIIRATVARAVARLTEDARCEPFDIILLDPPYDRSSTGMLTDMDRLLAPGGLLVLEHAHRIGTPAAAGRLERIRIVRSGDSALSFYTCQP
jgi:16S rRNA (guanine(966)-N(2))-methyltransferase RsmD